MNLFNTTIVVTGTITNSSYGVLKFDKPLVINNSEQETIRSTKLSRFDNGERVALTLSVGKSNSTTIINSHIILSGPVYGIVVLPGESIDEPDKYAKRIETTAKSLSKGAPSVPKQCLMNKNEIVAAYNSSTSFWLLVKLEFDKAKEIVDQLSESSRLHDLLSPTAAVAVRALPVAIETGEIVDNEANWVNGYYVSDENLEIFDMLESLHDTKVDIDLMIKGPSGFGKTTLMQALAKRLGYRYVRINCPLMLETTDWFAKQGAKDGTTYFEWQEFAKAIQDNNVVLVLDEVNRVPPHISNALFPLLDDSRATEYAGHTIKRGQNVVVAMTINEGWQYAGTYSSDEAFTNRVDIFIDLNAPDEDIERQIVTRRYPELSALQASRIVKMVRKMREVAEDNEIVCDVSTRSTLKVAKLVAHGMPLNNAITFAIVNGIEAASRKPFIDLINNNNER